MAFSFASVLLLILSGGATDILDLVHSDSYWKAKSVTVSVDQLLADAQAAPQAAGDPKTAKAGDIRRLMAIRTLGEMKAAQAVPALQGLLKSRELFVADYAQAALDTIAGKSPRRSAASDAVRKADLALLSGKIDLVAQLAPAGGEVMTIDKFFAGAPLGTAAPTEEFYAGITERVLRFAEAVGNVRLDCITVGVYTNAAGQPGNAVFIIHGLYDPQAVAAVAKEEAAGEIQENNLDGVTVLQNPKGPPALIFPSNERAVLIVGDSVAAMPVAQTAAAVKKGQGDLDTNADLAALIKSVDTTSMLWAVAKVTDGLRQEAPDLAPFDTVTLAATRKDAVDSLKVVAVGSDAAKVRGLVDQAQGVIAGALAESRQAAQQQPAVKPAVDFLESVKIDVDGGRATGTATLRLKELLVLLETTFRSQPPARTVAPAQPQPVQPPQQRPGL